MTSTNGNIETRLSALEVQMQELRDLLTQTAQIASSNAKAIQANSQSIADSRAETREAIQANSQATAELRETMRVSFMDLLGLHREIAIQQQQNTQSIADLRDEVGNLRSIVQDWITQDRE